MSGPTCGGEQRAPVARTMASSPRSAPAAFARLLHHPLAGRIAARIRRLAELGTAGYRPEVRRRLLILNLIAYLIVLTTFGYLLQYVALDAGTYKPVALINLALLVAASLVPLAHRISAAAPASLFEGPVSGRTRPRRPRRP